MENLIINDLYLRSSDDETDSVSDKGIEFGKEE